jgi:hypothetical protein
VAFILSFVALSRFDKLPSASSGPEPVERGEVGCDLGVKKSASDLRFFAKKILCSRSIPIPLDPFYTKVAKNAKGCCLTTDGLATREHKGAGPLL